MHPMLREFVSYPPILGKLLRHKASISPQRISFGPDKAQYALYFAPPCAPRGPVVIYIHGGGWNSGSPSMFKFIGECFAGAGSPCLLLGYRLSPKHRHPAQIEDVFAGFQAGLAALEKQGLRTDRAVIVGSSAGAHLGALLCYDADRQRQHGLSPEIFAGFCGLGSPVCWITPQPFVLRAMLRQLFPSAEDRLDGEPIRKLTSGQRVPMLLIHGRGDGVVGYDNAVRFAERAQSLGIPAELFTVPPESDTHSRYSAGCFLDTRGENPTLDALLTWIEGL